MNANTKRNLKSKSKTTPKILTFKDIILKKDPNDKSCATTSDTNNSQNESFIDIFKFNADKKTKLSSQNKKSESKSDDDFDELFSEFKSRTESSKSKSAPKSDDSFDELFLNFSDKAKTSTKETKPLISEEEKDFAEILRDNLSPRCPICFRKNNYDNESIYISHLKKCAYNNKMTMEQLKKALELQHRQTSERAALGLPIAPKEKPQRIYQNKGPVDSNLELGLALSNSLREYDCMNIIQEKEALVQAGIEPETLSQYRNLEDFGFASNKPAENTNFRGSKRNKNPPRNTVLFTRTQEERDRIITEKVANLLIDGDFQTSMPTEIISGPIVFKSKYLKKHIDAETTLWKKSSQLENNSENLYYVSALSNFITPCTVQAGSKLKHLSQIPCRPPSPDKLTTQKNVSVCVPSSPQKLSIVKPITKIFRKTVPITNTADSQLRLDWKYMLNKNVLSDLIIYTKNEVSIFAHKLVFYARCRSILTETIEEVENDKRSEMLMWLEYSFEAVMALLEYIYTGGLPNMDKLSDSNKKDLRALSNRYSIKAVIDALDLSEDAQLFYNHEDETSSKDYKMPSTMPTVLPSKLVTPIRHHISEIEHFSYNDSSPKNIAVEVTEGEKNLKMMLETMKTQNLRSPELFENDSYSEEVTSEGTKSQNQSSWEEVLSRLCSPVRSPLPEKQEIELDVSNFPVIDLTQEFETDKKTFEKRKSFSPLEKVELKKTRTLSEEKLPESPLSQVTTLSNTSACDSDESLYKIMKTTSDDSKSDFNLTSPSMDEVSSKDPGSSNSQNTNISGINEIHPVKPESLAVDNTLFVLNEQPCEEINPIWEGFEDFNSMPCDYDYFPQSAPIPVNDPLRELHSPCKPKISLRKSIADPLFGSFTVEADILDKIETEAVAAAAASKPSSSSTPDSVRKFQCRSRSENSITPINKCVWNNVTPIADYSNMKNEDLKKELEKYGIKPGLSRNKAKMMLKYIYEELHPFEDKVNVLPSKIDEIISHKDSENNTDRSANSCNSSDSDTSGVSLLEETYVEDDHEMFTQDSENIKTKVDLQTGFTNLLRDDKLLQRNILLYEPIWLEPLKTTLKEYGVRCSLSELMNYLDEKCVTFRTQKQRGKRKKNISPKEKKTGKHKATVDLDL